MKVSVLRWLVIALVFWALAPVSPLRAQDQARVTGAVVDATNAPVAGATVDVTNERTNEERTATTLEDGSFLVTELKPSFYTIRVSKDQFAASEVKGLQLTIGQVLRERFTLQVAQVTETVRVVAEVAPAIDTSNASIGVNVNEREVSELPLNGRQVSQLFLQAPGSVNSGAGSFGEIRFSGRAVEQNAVRYDGIEGGGVIDSQPGVLNGEIPTPFRLQSSLENVQEFRVDSNDYPAEYGTGTGGQISVVTKSGSNSFHGSGYEYFRNNVLDARNYFDLASKQSKLRLNQFGASVGGPIKKDDLFFFAYYEGYRLRSGINNIEAVPSAAVRALPACVGAQTPGTSFPYTCVNANARPLLPGFIGPVGTSLLPGASTDPQFDIYQLSGQTNLNEDSGGLRLDYRVNGRNSVFVRYFRDQGSWKYPEGVTGRNVLVTDNPQNAAISLQSTLSNTMTNEVKVGFNEALSRINGQAPTTNGVDYSTIAISISGAIANAGIAGQGSTTGTASPGGLVRSNSAANGRAQPYTPYSLSFVDNLSWLAGSHTLKFGAEVRMIRIYTDRLGGTTYSFGNLASFLANSATNVQYLGDVSSPSPYNNGATGNRLLKNQYYIGYVQDEFKIRRNLTLNYGLRYEFYSPLHEDRNLYVLFDINNGILSSPNYCFSPIVPVAQGVCSAPNNSWYNSNTQNFGPRIGISWSPFSSRSGLFGGERSVFRGGFGIYTGPGQAEDTLQPAESDRIAATISGGGYGVTTPASVTSTFLTNPNNRSAVVRAYAPEYTVPERIYQYSGSWQQQWGGGFVSTVAYVGSQGRNLFLRNIANRIVSVRTNTANGSAITVRQFDIDQGGNTVLHPFAEVDFKTSGGYDSYNALQTQLVKRSNSGLTLSAQYTYSKSFGDSAGSNEATTTADYYDYNGDRGYNNFDVRHTFNLSTLYDLPLGRNKRYMSDPSGVANALLGNWQIGTIVGARSGLPVPVYVTRADTAFVDAAGNVFSSQVTSGTFRTTVINVPGGGSSRAFRRPDLIPGVDPFLSNGWLNPAAFAVPKPGTFGNLVRNSIHGPGFVQADLTVSKKFPIRESVNVEFRAEVYNILNHPNFANPPSTISPTLGTGGANVQPGQPLTSASAGGGGVFGKFSQTVTQTVGIGTNRQVQLALRLNF